MATTTGNDEVEIVDIEGRPDRFVLARDALGIRGLFFCIATAAAPFTAILFNTPVTVLGSGWAAPAAFIVALVLLLLFTVGYVQIARRVPGAGGFYSFVSHGFGQILGLGTAIVVTASYVILTGALLGTFAYFANTSIDSWFGINIPVWALMYGVILIDVVFAWLRINLTARVLGVFFVAEVTAALFFALAVFFQGGQSGFSAKPLNPLDLFNNPSAVSVFGSAAAGVALFGAFWSWVGYEMAPNYSEESKHHSRITARATYVSLIAIGIILTVVVYAFVIGWGLNGAAVAVNKQFTGVYASAYYPLTDKFVGHWLTVVFQFLIITSCFACQLAFFNTASRYVFSLGRERVLPAQLGHTTAARQSPLKASIAVAVVSGVWVGGFLLYNSSTLAALTELGTWSPLVGVLGILIIQALVSLAIIRYFLTDGREYFHWWKTLLAPILGAAGMVFSSYLLVTNRDTLAGAKNVPFVDAVPWIVGALFVIGIGIALVIRARDSERYESIGRFVNADS
jgi:amino acid transporter